MYTNMMNIKDPVTASLSLVARRNTSSESYDEGSQSSSSTFLAIETTVREVYSQQVA